MSSPVNLPRPVADKLEQLRNFGYSAESIVACRGDSSKNYDILRTIPFDTLIAALVNGYVTDKTEGERHAELTEFYRRYLGGCDEHSQGIVDGVLFTLDILGITIEQINGGAC